MDVEKFLDHVRSASWYKGQITHVERIPERQARYAPLPSPLAPRLERILKQEGIEKLYAHQVRAVTLGRAGESVVVVTGTASGKTLCYNIPVLEGILEDPKSCALYLYPTKALAQDQLRTLLRYQVADPLLPLKAGTYDGDTSQALRRKLKNEANVILTNPDMLHTGILPNHGTWARFLSNLRFIVVDEVHAYRGIFGSNVSHVLKRLNRICSHYDSHPVYICCSATIRNPLELSEKLTARSMKLVDKDGSPRGEKTFIFWNPPFIGEGGMVRRSANLEAARLVAWLVSSGYQAIVFVRARVVSEVITRYTKEELSTISPSLSSAVKAYRGGYLPKERRRVERALFSEELKAVISTNALELGIDVGALEGAVLVGYPGNIASTWQQAGRAGRGPEPSLAVLIPYNSPVDQYMVKHPGYFFGQSPENAVIDPQNPHIVLSHLRAAAFELPIFTEERDLFGEHGATILGILEENHQVRKRGEKYYWCADSYPSSEVGLRSVGDDTYAIVETGERNKVIGTIDEASALMQVHPEAIYMHNGETYFVAGLDMARKIAYVERTDTDYYTQSLTEAKIKIEGERSRKRWRRSEAFFGDLSVTSLTYMFKKIKFGSRDSTGYGTLDLPPQTLLTTGMWLLPPAGAYASVREAGRVPREGLLGMSNVIKEVIPIFAMCDQMDVGASVDSSAASAPGVFVYDRYPGGLGFAQKAFEMLEEVMVASLDLIEACPCEDGCPSCVGSPIQPFSQQDPDLGSAGLLPDKEATKSILHFLLEKDPYLPRKSGRGRREASGRAKNGFPLPEPKKMPLEEQLRERVEKLKKPGNPRGG